MLCVRPRYFTGSCVLGSLVALSLGCATSLGDPCLLTFVGGSGLRTCKATADALAACDRFRGVEDGVNAAGLRPRLSEPQSNRTGGRVRAQSAMQQQQPAKEQGCAHPLSCHSPMHQAKQCPRRGSMPMWPLQGTGVLGTRRPSPVAQQL